MQSSNQRIAYSNCTSYLNRIALPNVQLPSLVEIEGGGEAEKELKAAAKATMDEERGDMRRRGRML